MKFKKVSFLYRGNDSFLEMIDYIRKVGGAGHTFMIVVDPDARGGKSFEFDGDGSDMISNIKVSDALYDSRGKEDFS